MVDQLEFEIIMKRKGTDYGKVAKLVGMKSVTTLTNKIKKGADISLEETLKLANVLEMNEEEYKKVFLKKLLETLV